MPEADYSLLWAAGKMASAGHATALYDGPSFAAWREGLFGPGLQQLDWIYPPPMVALGMAVAHVPLLPGYFLWVALTCGAAIWALRWAGLSWTVVLLGLFGPPTWRGMILGQYAPLAGALVVAGLLTARRAPVAAGLEMALATFKPHLGILVPLVWIAQRRWRAFGIAAASLFGLAALSTVLLGTAVWTAFLHGSRLSDRALLETYFDTGIPANVASVFWMARSFGASISASYIAQMSTAAVAAVVAWIAARRGCDVAATSVTTCLALLVSPYLWASDLVCYSIVTAMLVERRRFGALPFFLWVCPGISEIFVVLTGKAILPIFIALTAVLAWREFGGRTALSDTSDPLTQSTSMSTGATA